MNRRIARLALAVFGMLALTIGAAAFPGQSHARGEPSRIILYEGNGCTQDVVGVITTVGSHNLKQLGWNDEARSLMFVNTAPLDLYVYDSPKGDAGDDWSYISFAGGTICVDTFEMSWGEAYSGYVPLIVEYHPHNGLDGKVSRIDVFR